MNPLTPGWASFWLVQQRLEAQGRLYGQLMTNRAYKRAPVALYEPGAAFPSTRKPDALPIRQPKAESCLGKSVFPKPKESLSPPDSLLVTPSSSLSPVVGMATCSRVPIGVGYVRSGGGKNENVKEDTRDGVSYLDIM